ncbi:MAG: FtsQ-type POTRA domain-containing protein [Verrucomicrobia bacterium]|nr:FtsQ-type POTRA domain-containing protein [Verrucomicrobiota bacterium]NBU07877.1 FtsQ-type POTRA domain-containing protein [Pseudomonadota bacterium]NDA68675.1 FtsQ-type POTRA domain-containing protein [Verrucomicrobiota bacterium]NDB77030.1 FtsQ-type POTRA domain-containing protein [Verrucomicrobiota bacterium]NDD40420.1 FtsQ-type POTRA domain-containing protein [Verrucomicrobiota bacterium]
MLRKLTRLFKGNRRLQRENENVLRVKLRTDQLHAARTRFAVQVVTVLFGSLVVLFLGWRGVDWAVREFVTENPAFAIKRIDLQTEGVLTVEALRKWAGVRVGENLMSLDLARIKRDLELVPLLQSAAVERVLPDTLRIRVTERVPVAQVVVLRPDASGRYVPVPHLLDATGFVMMPADRTMVADPAALQIDWLPALTGVNPVDLKPGRQVESAQVRAALRLLTHFERSAMFGRADIRRVDVSGLEVLTATTSARTEITFATNHDFDMQLRRWRAVQDVATQQGKVIATLDVSISQNLPARWVEASSVPTPPAKVAKPAPYRRKNA